jgi:hypothetical protein
MKADFLSIGWKDILKGLVMAFLSAILTGIYQLLQTGAIFNWPTLKPVLLVGVTAMVAYIIKNFFTNSQNQLLVTEKKATPEIVKPVQNLQTK